MEEKMFHPDDLVWAKMPNYPHWPGIIIASDDGMIETCGPLDPKKGDHYVYFFGTENYAAIPIKKILPHSQEMFDKHDKKKRISKDLRAAIDAMKEYCLSSVALDLHSNEPISNDENPSCDLMSRVKVVTEHSVDSSDDLSCEQTMSEVNLVTDEYEIDDVCCESFTSKVVAKQANDFGAKSSSGATTLKVVTAEPEIGLSCESLTSEVVAKQAIDISIESSCAPTMPKVVATEHTEFLCCEPLTSKVVAKQPIDFGVDSGSEPTMPKAKRLCVTLTESPEVQYEESFLPQSRRIGFVGLGELGVKIVRKLIETDHDVTVYDKNLDKLNYSNILGAKESNSIIDVCDKCELIFCCASDVVSQELFVFEDLGILSGLQKTKNKHLRGYIEMTPMDETQLIMTAEAVAFAGVPFLEVPVSGPHFLANGELNVFAAGDKNLFIECLPIFCKISNKEATYIGNKIGQALVADQMFNALTGSLCAASKEALDFATIANKIPRDNFRELFDLCEMTSSLITRQMNAVEEKTFDSTDSLNYLQQDTQRVLSIGNQMFHKMPIVAQSYNSSFLAQL